MGRRFLCAALVMLALGSASCHRGQLRLRTRPNSSIHQWRNPISPEAFRRPCVDLPCAVEPPVGYAQARRDPLDPFIVNVQVRWNSTVEVLCGQFDRLCELHNQAGLTVQEFNQRKKELLKAVRYLAIRKAEFQIVLAQYRLAKDALHTAGAQQGEGSSAELAEARSAMEKARATAEGIVAEAAQHIEAPAPIEPE